ncbi:FAD-dependent oxidoreductase [Aquimarina sp. 2201CG5-10]|uniref:NAD(P)/FAD-dependent oxidoreductase n=1 Tax=Aquimarina callyspongiae TaxID=3098150 RepID=UPI002AB55567|nr:FAD-dependent oxidoreductase [Aquimarina sp. 2201CG5-10]MDY8134698.1 FAD-dependent oxidoreductase [Aquimarina sp. 2201CG5-10]
MVDYIVVGFGLAGLSFVEQLERNGKSYLVYEDYSQKSSRVAGGLYNPIILKRFTAAWKAQEQTEIALPFYRGIEKKLQESLVFDLPVLRRFNSIEEQNMWFEACDKPILNKFLSSDLISNTNIALDIPYHYGRVKDTRRINIQKMLACYAQYLEKKDLLIRKSFKHEDLNISKETIEYKGNEARNIVFTEGYGVTKNPLFNYLPLYGNKGEYIVIKSSELELKEAVKSSVFIIPLGENLYKVGATYNNKDNSQDTTSLAKIEIEKKLKTFLKTPYEIVDQVAGIRPTVKDRRPLVGTHPEYSKVHILNGLGSRGIIMTPSMASQLYNYIHKGIPLDIEIDIRRFEKLG